MSRIVRSEEERTIIAYNIRKRRKKGYDTSGQCARDFKVAHSQWSTWESGSRTPDPESLAKIAKFLKCTTTDLSTAPENWPEEKEKFIRERDQASTSKKPKPLPEPEPAPKAVESTYTDDGTSDYISIVAMLAKVQSKFDRGEIPPEQFTAKMQSIREFVNFSYRGLLDDKQSAG